MQIFDSNALIQCIQDAVREEIKSALKEVKTSDMRPSEKEKLLTKKEMAEELDVSLVTLTDWMKKGLPFLRLNKRIYFRREEVLKSMSKNSRHR
ncbi:MAG: helix-turn-helix domain-containing protein [Cyclobacteriaceae bacterium]